jgi:hypothetical protein
VAARALSIRQERDLSDRELLLAAWGPVCPAARRLALITQYSKRLRVSCAGLTGPRNEARPPILGADERLLTTAVAPLGDTDEPERTTAVISDSGVVLEIQID